MKICNASKAHPFQVAWLIKRLSFEGDAINTLSNCKDLVDEKFEVKQVWRSKTMTNFCDLLQDTKHQVLSMHLDELGVDVKM